MKANVIPVILALVITILVPRGADASQSFPFGDTWRAVEIDGKTTSEGIDSTLRINRSGVASGQAACNRYSTEADIEEETLSFRAIAMTRMMCPEDRMDQEQRFQAALAATARWETADGVLTLYDDDGNIRLRFELFLVEIRFKVALPAGTEVETETVVYQCEDRELWVDYINAGPISLAILRMPDETIVASEILSASGARYAGGRYVWWTKGSQEATLELVSNGDDKPAIRCQVE